MAYIEILNQGIVGKGEGWATQHNKALAAPEGFERSLRSLFAGWLMYADEHAKRYESGIGKDRMLGPHWATIAVSIRALLNGDCGRLDCGTLDSILVNVLREHGFDADNM